MGMHRALLVLVVALAAGLGAGTPSVSAASQTAQRDAALERAIVDRINTIRVQHDLKPLAVARGLSNAALAHTRALASRGLFQHESADGTPFHKRVGRYYAQSGFGSWSVGENLVFGTAPFDADDAVQAWLDSPGHRRNMLSPHWREVGVGVIVAHSAPGVYGGDTVVIATADFGTRRR
jgi:uncharacterized protein YkwD